MVLVSGVHPKGGLVGQSPLIFENPYGHNSKRYPKKGHDKKIGTPPLKKEFWIRP